MKKRFGTIFILLILLLTFLTVSCKIIGVDDTLANDDVVIIADDEIMRFSPPDDYEITTDGGSVLNSIDNSETEIGVMTQEYIGENIAEILMIKYDGSQPEFEQYNWKNPEIETINLTIKSGIQQVYNDFMNDRENAGDDWYEWIEIKSYPFTSDDYLQIVTTSVIYPTYGTDGDMTSYNFSKKENRYILLEDVMADWGFTEEIITQNVKELYVPESPSSYIKEVTPVGFLFRYATDPYTIFLLEVTVSNPDAGEWKCFYAYEPSVLMRQFDEFYKLNSKRLFDPHDMDQMEPPLYYGQTESGNDLKFADLQNMQFMFSSGVGAWRTTLDIFPDGTFAGNYSDSDMGDVGEGYPGGTEYVCAFSGNFTLPVKTGDYEYLLVCESITQVGTPGEEVIIDGVRTVTSIPYGLETDESDRFILYLPGKKIGEMPEGFLEGIMPYADFEGQDTISFYILYNTGSGNAFIYES